MKNIHITLQNLQLEQDMLRLSTQQHQSLQEFIITALDYYIKEMDKVILIKKLDLFQHTKVPTEDFKSLLTDENNTAFSDIEDSNVFAKKLRQQAWNRYG